MILRKTILAFSLFVGWAAAQDAPVPATIVSLVDTTNTDTLPVSWRVREVRDLRKLGAKDPTLLGTWSPLPFEARTALRTERTVARELEVVLGNWTPAGAEIPVRIELLSFETWSEPVPGPDPVHAKVSLRVVSLDSSRPGALLVPKAFGDRKLAARSSDQVGMLLELLRDVLSQAKPPFVNLGDTTTLGEDPSPWADPASSPVAKAEGRRRLRQIVGGQAIVAWRTVGAGVRYTQHLEPANATWTPEYWGGFQFRGPWTNEEFAKVWSGELQGGMAWNRRLDAGASNFLVVASAGGSIGIEGSRPVHEDGTVGDRKTFATFGGEGRFGVRRHPVGSDGPIWGTGVQLSIRVPSRLGWIDPAAFLEVGWGF
ncbi:MAG: hypothetical protein H6686_04980 [Fibrobacteria bacterium]|nr:hypothetical protein [Fibrobacteria bacterium]